MVASSGSTKNSLIRESDSVFHLAVLFFYFLTFAFRVLTSELQGAEPIVTDASDRVSMRIWGLEHGLPSTFVRQIIEARDGRLWLATKKGLSRFDGHSFFVPAVAADLSGRSLDCLSVAEARGGVILVGTTAGIWTFSGGELSRFERDSEFANRRVNALEPDPSGGVWAATDRGLYYLEDHAVEGGSVAPLWGLSEVRANDCVLDFAGNLWVATVGGVRILDAGTRVLGPVSLPAARYHLREAVQIQVAESGRIVARFRPESGGGAVALEWDGANWGPYEGHQPGATGMAVCKTGDTPFFLLQSYKFAKFNGLHEIFYRPDLNMVAPWINCLTQDSDGTFWMGVNYRGLVALFPKNIQLVYAEVLESLSPIWSIDRDQTNTFWVGHEGGVSSFRAGHWTHYEMDTADAPSPTRSVLCGTDGVVWAGGSFGLQVRQEDQFVRVSEKSVSSHESNWVLFEDSAGNFWSGNPRGVSIFPKNNRASPLNLQSPDDSDIRAICEYHKGRIWLAGSTGQIWEVLLGKTLEMVSVRMSLNGPVSQFLVDSSGMLWAVDSNGLVCLGEEGFEKVEFAPGLLNSSSMAILETAPRHLLLVDQQGFLHVQSDSLKSSKRGAEVRNTHGARITPPGTFPLGGIVTGTGQPLGCQVSSDSVWWPTRMGICKVPLVPPDRIPAPRVIIDEVIATGKSLIPVRLESGTSYRIELPPATGSSVSVRLSCDELREADLITFQYRLSSGADSWLDIGREREVRFFNLSPGTHSIRIRASKIPGVWEDSSTSLQLTIVPLFSGTITFKFIFAGLIGAATALVYRWRVECLRKIEQLEERGRLSRGLHDSLGGQLVEIDRSLRELAEGGKTLPPEQVTKTLESRISSLFASIRELVWAIEPPDASISGLFLRIGDCAQTALVDKKIRLEIEWCDPVPDNELSWPTRHHVFLAAKEAITNIIRHADATSVRIEFMLLSNIASVTILDDGVGFSPDPTSGADTSRRGIETLRWRLNRLGGCAVITSKPEHGCSVSIQFPLNR